MKTRFWRSAFVVALAAAICPTLGAWTPVGDIVSARPLPETWEARTQLSEIIFEPAVDAAHEPRRVVHQPEAGRDALFASAVQEGAVFLEFIPRKGGRFPPVSSTVGAGTFIIKRSLADGSFLQAKVFVQNNPDCYVRLFPDGGRTAMDIVLYGVTFQSNVPVPASFRDLLTAPFERIIELSSSSIDWPLVMSPDQAPGDARVEQVVQDLRGRLGTLRDMDDGAMDQQGRLVFIASGMPAPSAKGGFNCSGFAKWVIDGFYAPLAGSLTDINALRSRDSDLLGKAWTEKFEEEQDPYFGLDWSRGLARALADARTGRMPGPDALDVTDSERFTHVKDVGYKVGDLQALLYFLARSRPGTLYLGSVNARSRGAPAGSSMLLRQHHHVVVFLPYFDDAGDFHAVVMERNKETSVSSLARRYPSEYVNLVKVDVEGPFQPVAFPR